VDPPLLRTLFSNRSSVFAGSNMWCTNKFDEDKGKTEKYRYLKAAVLQMLKQLKEINGKN